MAQEPSPEQALIVRRRGLKLFWLRVIPLLVSLVAMIFFLAVARNLRGVLISAGVMAFLFVLTLWELSSLRRAVHDMEKEMKTTEPEPVASSEG